MIEDFILNGQPLWVVFKSLALIGLVIYIIFALVVIRQVNKMTDTLAVGFEAEVRFVAIVHFILALATFIVAFAIL